MTACTQTHKYIDKYRHAYILSYHLFNRSIYLSVWLSVYPVHMFIYVNIHLYVYTYSKMCALYTYDIHVNIHMYMCTCISIHNCWYQPTQSHKPIWHTHSLSHITHTSTRLSARTHTRWHTLSVAHTQAHAHAHRHMNLACTRTRTQTYTRIRTSTQKIKQIYRTYPVAHIHTFIRTHPHTHGFFFTHTNSFANIYPLFFSFCL